MKNSFDLKDKVVVITGALGILGERFCSNFAELGAKVIAVDLDNKKTEEFSKNLSKKYGSESIGIGCDVSNPADVKRMVEQVIDQVGIIDALLNNAATKTKDLKSFLAPFEEYSLDTWREVMSVNVDGMFLVAQAVGSQMKKQSTGGSIIQTASIYGVVAPDHRIYEGSEYMGSPINSPASYSASKSAVLGLTKYLAAYWAKNNIRVNAITPGGVESGQNDTFKDRYAERVPMKRMAKSDDIVGAALYLASDLSAYVTGQNLIVDGGLTSW